MIATQNLESFFMPKQPATNMTPRAYLELYGLDDIASQHAFHTIEAKGFKVSVQVFSPTDPCGQIFLMHGFTDHIGSHRKIIQYLVKRNLKVIAYDHPGHGLTNGNRGEIDDFSTYAEVANLVIKAFDAPHLPRYLMAHSMGGAVALDLLYQHPNYQFKTIFLLAPLIKICQLTKKRLLFRLMGRLKGNIARSFSVNSNDPVFMRFLHGYDPLQLKMIPPSWLNAYFRWFDRTKKKKPLSHTFAIITGTADLTVDSLYTTQFFGHWPHVSLLSLAGARHHLPGEADLYQQRFQDFFKANF